MSRLRTHRIAILVTCACIAMIAAGAGPHGVMAQTAGAAQAAAGVIGFGFWGTLACIGCIAGFVVGAGTTIAGLAVFLAANPEIAILCVSTCAIAAT